MRKTPAAVLLLTLTVPLLSGCHFLFGKSRSFRAELPPQQDPHAFAAAQMAAGREALSNEQYGAAVIAFRNAWLAPEYSAAASNGLAIAYSEIGRPDLAERYFKRAIAEAPGDVRYRSNLALFYERTPLFASREMRSEMLGAADSSSPVQLFPGAEPGSTIRVVTPISHLVRVSAYEVRLDDPKPGASAPPRRAPVRVAAATQEPVRASNPNSSIRVSVPQHGAVSVETQAGFPVRASQ